MDSIDNMDLKKQKVWMAAWMWILLPSKYE